MSLEINSVVIGGNLTRDVDLKVTSTGAKVCTFSVASNRTFLSGGNKNVETSFLDVDVWGVIAENCSKYLKKGSPVVVVGRLKQERWESPSGEKRNKIKIIASNVQFLSFSGNQSPNSTSQQPMAASNTAGGSGGWEE